MAANLCPYCGHTGSNPDQCEGCRGLLEPLSRRATQIAMGPWFIRDARRPFNPGASYAVLTKLIAAGKVKPGTPLRGPTTHQLWAPARLVPGVAHLTGFCHECGVGTETKADRCAECGAAFPVPTERDDLGIADIDAAAEVTKRRRLTHHMCPGCGHSPTLSNRCDMCKVVFSPPTKATQFDLGPWYIRDIDAHFQHGVSYAALKRLVEEKLIDGGTILRGPSTHQFYHRADETPGVAHLLGKCHECGKSVETNDTLCIHCEEPFEFSFDDNRLGLVYTTQADADAAQEQLDAEVEQFMATAPAPVTTPKRKTESKKRKPKRKRQAAASDAHDEATVYAAGAVEHTHVESDSTHDHEEHDVPVAHVYDEYGEEVEYHDDPAAALADAGHHDHYTVATHDSHYGGYQAAVAGGPDPTEQAALRRQEQKLKSMAVVLITVFVLAGGTLIGVLVLTGDNDGPPTDGQTVNNTDDDGPSKTDVRSFDEMRLLLTDMQAKWEEVKGIDRANGVGDMLDRIESAIKLGDAFIKSGDAGKANENLTRAKSLADQVHEMDRARAEAKLARADADAARRQATDGGVPTNAKQAWDEGTGLIKQAEESFAAGRFNEAGRFWRDARTVLDRGRTSAKDFAQADKARQAFEAAVTETFTREQLDQMAGDRWAQIKSMEADAKTAIAEGKLDEAIQLYTSAQKFLPEAFENVKLELGTNYWAVMAGRTVATVLIEIRSNQPYSESRANKVFQAYKPLRLGDDFYLSLPRDPASKYEDLVPVIWQRGPQLIEEKRGKAANLSFSLGVKVELVQQYLKQDVLTIEPATRAKILKQAEQMKEIATEAKYPSAFKTLLGEFEEQVKATPDKTAVKESRRIWRDLLEKLDAYDTGAPLVVP